MTEKTRKPKLGKPGVFDKLLILKVPIYEQLCIKAQVQKNAKTKAVTVGASLDLNSKMIALQHFLSLKTILGVMEKGQ